MEEIRIKRNFYRYPKYYYTALRFMVEIFKAPKPKSIDYNYELYKTQRKYIIDTFYTAFVDGKRRKKIPVQISIPITSKDREDLRITVSHGYWPYRQQIQDELKAYYLSLRTKKETCPVPRA